MMEKKDIKVPTAHLDDGAWKKILHKNPELLKRFEEVDQLEPCDSFRFIRLTGYYTLQVPETETNKELLEDLDTLTREMCKEESV